MFFQVSTIQARCDAVGMTVTGVLREAKVSWSNYSRWRSGDTGPTVKVLNRIDAVLKKYEAEKAEKDKGDDMKKYA